MVKKDSFKKVANKIDAILFLTITFSLFVLIFLITFLITRHALIFSNKTLNFVIILIFYLVILWVLSDIYYKIFKFDTKKEILTKKEFNHLLKKKKDYRIKVSKKENRIPKASLKRLKELNEEGEILNKEFYKGAVFFKSYIVFILFSIYYGTSVKLPIWALKNSLRYLPTAIKNFFTINFLEGEYFWDQIKISNRKTEYHISYISSIKYLNNKKN